MLAPFRRNRHRFKQFAFGSQWEDIFITPKGEKFTEGEYASRNGRYPLTNNMIQRLLKTLVGHYRASRLSDLKADHNRLPELDARTMEEFLISGAAIHRVVRERRPQAEGERVWVDPVNPDLFFCYPLRDPRALDVEFIGMYHDWSITEAIGRFAGGNRERARELRNLLRGDGSADPDFDHCTIIEVWCREACEQLRCHDPLRSSIYTLPLNQEVNILATNQRRKRRGEPRVASRFEVATKWVGRFLTTDGCVLHTVTAPSHPFAVKFYPLLDGEIHSFVSGIIDQQKYVNRLITLIDNMMSTSAKGVLLFPEDELSESLSWEDVTSRWANYDGVIPYLPKAGSPGPHQVITNPSNCGAYELLNMEMKLFEQVSGVTEALQGSSDGSGNSAQLFDARTRNSMAALTDIFAAFDDFRQQRDNIVENLLKTRS